MKKYSLNIIMSKWLQMRPKRPVNNENESDWDQVKKYRTPIGVEMVLEYIIEQSDMK